MFWVLAILMGIGSFMLARYVVRPRYEARRRQRILPPRFVALEVHTSGPGLDKHEVIAVAAIGVRPGVENHPYIHALIKPAAQVPRKAAEAAGTTAEEIAAQGKPAADVLAALLEFAGSDRLVLYNAPAQMAFLHKLAGKHGVAIDNPVSDALSMARAAWPGRSSFKIRDLARSLNIALPQRNHPLHECGLIAAVYTEAALKLKRTA